MTGDSKSRPPEVICVVGPTASGKSELAQSVAMSLGGEIVSADSMQIYRGMDIGTGKMLASEQKVPHWGLDIVDPGEPYSAALFQDYARNRFSEIDARGNKPILCGGTGFYVRAAIDDYSFPAGEQQDNPVRDRYRATLDELGPTALWELLRQVDEQSADVIAPADSKRVIRALELAESGISYARQKERLQSIPQHVPARFIGIAIEPEQLRRRIDARVDSMIDQGLVDEVQQLLDKGFRQGLCAPKAIGYKEIVAYLDGELSLDDAVGAIKTATHRYAKRQRTWFRKDKRIHWIEGGCLHRMLDESLGYLRESERLSL